MTYSFPVFRKGMVFKAEQIVEIDDARNIAKQIKLEDHLYNSAFVKAVKYNNGATGFKINPNQKVRQHIEESYILNFPGVSFQLNEFSVDARNSVTVCMHKHQSKIWTRLSCSGVNGEPAKNLSSKQVRRFFALANEKAELIIDALAKTYKRHVRQAGVRVPTRQGYYFKLRAFNSTDDTSEELLNELRQGLTISEALKDKEFQENLTDYFSIVVGKSISPAQIKKAIKDGQLDVFGYESPDHQAIFTAKINDSQTDICGFGFDDKNKLSSKILSHATTKDILKEYAQQF